MEIDVTPIVQAHLNGDVHAQDCSGSQAEHGCDAARFTWNTAMQTGKLLDFDEATQDAVRSHLCEMGAWTDEEIEAYTKDQLQAFIVQETMAEVRRLEEYENLDLAKCEWEEWDRACQNEGGRLQRFGDNEFSYYVGI
jgi:hypothetical protein